MRTLLALVRKDFTLFFRNRAAVSLTFLVPVALIYIFGQVFGLNKKDSGPSGIPLAVVNASDSPAAARLVAALQAESSFRVITRRTAPDGTARPLAESDLRPMIHDREFRFALVIPADLVRDDRIGLHLKIYSDPRNEIESQTVAGLLQKTVFSNAPELLGQSLQARAKKHLGAERLDQFNGAIASAIAGAFGGDKDAIQRNLAAGAVVPKSADPALRRLDAAPAAADASAGAASEATTGSAPAKPAAPPDYFSKIVQIDTEQVVGKDVKSPEATRIVGGWAIMFLLFALSNSAASFFDEENAGLFQRLLSAPIRRSQLLWSRFLYGVLLGLVQLSTLFYAGHLLYGIDVFGHLLNLVIVCTAAAAACTGFGMLIAAIARTPQAASGLATFLVLTMSACGGAWFPVSFMPEIMQHFAKLTLVYWAMEGFAQVLWAGDSLAQLLPILGILAGITAAVMAVALWRFNRSRLFA
jgi:ABC-2 type transport system permease protein